MYIVKRHPNWRASTRILPPLATFLGGFSLTLMVLSLRKDTRSIDFSLLGTTLPSHTLGLILLTVAVLLFVYSIQCLLRAQSYNYFDIEQELVKLMAAEAKKLDGDIEQYIAQMDSKCRTWYLFGSRLFDFATAFLLGGAAVILYPYSVFATALFCIGIVLEFLWIILER